MEGGLTFVYGERAVVDEVGGDEPRVEVEKDGEGQGRKLGRRELKRSRESTALALLPRNKGNGGRTMASRPRACILANASGRRSHTRLLTQAPPSFDS